ncbi:hypothetical protein L7F22_036398 [Adiantum nelumboides]|nr:hypothetical protein [Adiantum nelumboides]
MIVAVSSLASSSAGFLEGEDFGGLYRPLQFGQIKRLGRSGGPRAAAEDVPTFKGYSPMMKRPRWWWRVLACIPYLMPLSETWMYAETAYSLHSFLEDYEFSTYPFLVFIGKLPSWFLLASSALILELCATIAGHIFSGFMSSRGCFLRFLFK